MRTIKHPKSFKRDYKRESKGEYSNTLGNDLSTVVESLSKDQPLGAHYRDHKLLGEWKGCRECHIKPDLLLIYEKTEDNSLILCRLGSHSELFG